jgi:hypothetical protein
MKCGKEKGKGRMGDEVRHRERKRRLHVTKHIVLYITVTVAKYIELNGLIG